MGRPKRWTAVFDGHGMSTVKLASWKYFGDLMREFASTFQATSTVWRGQAAGKWPLESSIERELRKAGRKFTATETERQLSRFKLAARGRRGPAAHPISAETDWWALGQHHGLATPFVDWTRSPWVALYFAFASESSDGDSQRAVWALNRRNLERLGALALKANATESALEFIDPLSDDNARLVNQGGLFVKSPDGIGIVDWVRKHVNGTDATGTLMKINIPSRERVACLRSLDHMNINHVTLFPDLYGASRFCNDALRNNAP